MIRPDERKEISRWQLFKSCLAMLVLACIISIAISEGRILVGKRPRTYAARSEDPQWYWLSIAYYAVIIVVIGYGISRAKIAVARRASKQNPVTRDWMGNPIGKGVQENEPNKALEPTTMAVTIRAPSSTARASHVVAHLERSAKDESRRYAYARRITVRLRAFSVA
jgi:hypothetical protein